MISSAVAVPRWSSTRKGTKLSEAWLKSRWRMAGTTTAWPSEDTGKSSVAPWSTPMNELSPKDTEPKASSLPGSAGRGPVGGKHVGPVDHLVEDEDGLSGAHLGHRLQALEDPVAQGLDVGDPDQHQGVVLAGGEGAVLDLGHRGEVLAQGAP